MEKRSINQLRSFWKARDNSSLRGARRRNFERYNGWWEDGNSTLDEEGEAIREKGRADMGPKYMGNRSASDRGRLIFRNPSRYRLSYPENFPMYYLLEFLHPLISRVIFGRELLSCDVRAPPFFSQNEFYDVDFFYKYGFEKKKFDRVNKQFFNKRLSRHKIYISPPGANISRSTTSVPFVFLYPSRYLSTSLAFDLTRRDESSWEQKTPKAMAVIRLHPWKKRGEKKKIREKEAITNSR